MKSTVRYFLFALMLNTSFVTKERELIMPEIAVIVELEVYPNPTTDYLYVRFINGEPDNFRIEIVNFIGNKEELTLSKQNSDTYRIDVSKLSRGYYYLILHESDTQKKSMKKFLKN
jgi:hypothetical protein